MSTAKRRIEEELEKNAKQSDAPEWDPERPIAFRDPDDHDAFDEDVPDPPEDDVPDDEELEPA
jgi:hypothetical protein